MRDRAPGTPDAGAIPGQNLGTAVATIALTLAGCLCTGVLAVVGAPRWEAIIGLLVPAFIFFILRRTACRAGNLAGAIKGGSGQVAAIKPLAVPRSAGPQPMRNGRNLATVT